MAAVCRMHAARPRVAQRLGQRKLCARAGAAWSRVVRAAAVTQSQRRQAERHRVPPRRAAPAARPR
eukprot:28015-Prymnesium_polylepis.1